VPCVRGAVSKGPWVTELETRLRQGLALHRQGRLNDAARLYHEVLQRQPNHFEALHLLGVAALQSRRPELGLQLIRQAIKVDGSIVGAHIALGNGLRDLGRLEEALASYDHALALAPDNGRAWYIRGNALLNLNRPEAAAESFDRCIALSPDYVEAYNGRGNALCALQRPDDALASFDQSIALKPGFAEAHHNRGNALLTLRRFDEALESHDNAVALKPGLAEAHSGRGNALWELNRPEAALASYDKAISLKPDYADAHCNRCNALRDLKRFDEALASCDVAIRLRPNHAQAHHNRGNALVDLKRPEEAVASYDKANAINPGYARAYFNRANALLVLTRREEAIASFDNAIALRPDDVPAYSNRGNVRLELANIEDAIVDFDTAIALQPDYAPAHCNRGNAMVALLRLSEAAACFRTAIALQPDYGEAHWNDGLRLLLTGQFEQGWRSYEWRKQLKYPVAVRPYPQPLWLGEQDIAGKVLFIYWEQGLGDTIQFYRYAKLAEARGAKIVMEVQHVLHGLLTQLSATIQLITPDETPSPFDYHCPLMSLPLAFGTTLATIPAEPYYLWADETMRAIWSARLDASHASPIKKPRIGIAWSGSADHHHDHLRSLTLATCLPLLDQDADWICLQKEIRDTDSAARQRAASLRSFSDELGDFSDTSALVDQMDLVITVDTSVAHLAGAMGKPVWVLLPYSPDWRSLLDRDDSPWYPSAKLFRQPRVGDWDSVIDQVARALASINIPVTR
jgi:tetratricopeptide (TPR) repeat protein